VDDLCGVDIHNIISEDIDGTLVAPSPLVGDVGVDVACDGVERPPIFSSSAYEQFVAGARQFSVLPSVGSWFALRSLADCVPSIADFGYETFQSLILHLFNCMSRCLTSSSLAMKSELLILHWHRIMTRRALSLKLLHVQLW